ncbi:hypothetical protein Rhal01_03243 [Rubritalea halochordaticola]|uniref:FecR family protein n=1 Tax=Rubritalea halochordaticola TaxID=714537 RepID=A0ABP9V374_9BACT
MTKEVHVLVQKLVDGDISPQEFDFLQDQMEANPSVRELYYDYVSLEQGLQFRLARKAQQSGLAGLAELRLRQQRKLMLKVATISSLAAAVLIAIGLSLFFIEPEGEGLQYASSPGTQFKLVHPEDAGEIPNGQMVVGSRMEVSQGVVEFQLDSGVRAVISGPADISLQSKNRLFMKSGNGWFDVPEKAHGFTVQTSEFEVVDLGTKFGIIADLAAEDQVHVFQGKVRVHALQGKKQQRELTEGNALRVYPAGDLEATGPESDYFLTQLPTELPHLHFSFEHADDLLGEETLTSQKEFGYQYHGDRADFESGRFGNALRLNGLNNYLETNWPGILGDQPRTVAFWIKMPKKRISKEEKHISDTIVGWGMQRDQNEFEMNFNSKWTIHLDYSTYRRPSLNVSFGAFWYYVPDAELDDNQWHHLAVTYSGLVTDEGKPFVRVYLDGKPVWLKVKADRETVRDLAGNVAVRTLEKTPLVVGATLSSDPMQDTIHGQYLGALIDELYIIQGEIDEATVHSLMEKNRISTPPSVVGEDGQ